MQGSNVEIMGKKYEPRVNYLSFQLVNKFYFNQFNMHIGPSIDVSMGSKNFKMNNTTDLGILFGLGYDINKNFGIEARIKKGMIPVTNSGSEDNTNVLIQTGLTFTFPNGKE